LPRSPPRCTAPPEAAGAAAVAEARALPGDRNKWKIQIARTLAKRAVIACLR